MIIAIDGPSGAGKSTLGKRLATELDLLYLDTGAMYRAAALSVLVREGNFYDVKETTERVAQTDIELSGAPANLRVWLDRSDVSDKIRTPEVSQAASIISTIPAVRRILVERQKQLGLNARNGCVLDGRDIGTIVFPNADVKIFLTATPESRAARRFAELKEKHIETTLEETLHDIVERDTRDSSRHDSPLKVAADAIVIDSTALSTEQVFEIMLTVVRDKRKSVSALQS
jgi:cytidylate kinase